MSTALKSAEPPEDPKKTSIVPLMPAWATASLKPFLGRSEYELVLPAIPVNSVLGKGLVASVSVVQISADPADGEVFKVGSKKDGQGWKDVLSYAKPGLERLANAAGIQVRTRRTDDRRDPDLCEFEAVGAMRNESGEIVMRTGTAAIRLSQYREDRWTEVMSSNAAKDPKWQKKESDLKASFEAEMAQFRKHFVSRVETKAALRVVRSLLAIKSQLTAEQVAKPKVLVRISPDMNDPEIRGAMLARGISARDSLYGPDPSRAEVVEPRSLPAPVTAEEDGEPLDPVTPGGEAPSDPRKVFEAACAGFGLSFLEAADILARNGNDHGKAAAEIERMANQKESGA